MQDVVCCLDAGTTRIKAALVDPNGMILINREIPAPQPLDAYQSFDAADYFAKACTAIADALATLPGTQVNSLAVCAQRATIIPLDARDQPAGNALSWQDSRGEEETREFITRYGAERFHRETGLPSSPLWSLARILWLRAQRGAAHPQPERFALLHDYLLRRMGAEHLVTDPSNASVTGLMLLRKRCWNRELLNAAGIAETSLPEILPPGSIAGKLSLDAAKATGLAAGLPLVVGGGDQQCAALGLGIPDPGATSLCLGTAAIISSPLDAPPEPLPGGFFCTAHAVPGRWMLEGIINSAGSCIQWAMKTLRIADAAEWESCIAASPPGARGLRFLPWLAGIGSPDFDALSRGSLAGIGLEHGRNDMARAVQEGVALEIWRALDAQPSSLRANRLVAAGGGARPGASLQILADILHQPIRLRCDLHASLAGAACMAWTGAGRHPSPAEAARALRLEHDEASPGPEAAAYDKIKERYRQEAAAHRNAPEKLAEAPA